MVLAINFISFDVVSILPKWNNATLLSLKENFHKTVNPKEKRLYDNRTPAMTALWGIKEDSEPYTSFDDFKFQVAGNELKPMTEE